MIISRLLPGLLLSVGGVFAPIASQAETVPPPDKVLAAMLRATQYYHETVAVNGGYVYFYSEDLSRRLGEGVALPDQVWVQAPGTPRVGIAYVEAYLATGKQPFLSAAQGVAGALLHGQLATGGWTNSISFTNQDDRAGRYRDGRGRQKGKDFSTLDDGITQGALQFLIRLDAATNFENATLREAIDFALTATLRAQFPNGAFPQGWDDQLAVPDTDVSLRASLPEYDWRTEGRIKEYWDLYNLNDNIAGHVVDTLRLADLTYGREDCREALRKLGEFLILAQLPAPQPAWAQQYRYDMRPAWARKFEPPAVASVESGDVIEALMKIALHLEDADFLAPVPAALDYLKAAELEPRRLARFYELGSNRPLYMSRRGDVYSLTYDDSDLPSHYGWKTTSPVERLRNRYKRIIGGETTYSSLFEKKPSITDAAEIIASLDAQGRWITIADSSRLIGDNKFSEGERVISSEVFAENLEILAATYRAAEDLR
ncbi:MAG: pectate lyase [Verrucomicrobiota bacterium]